MNEMLSGAKSRKAGSFTDYLKSKKLTNNTIETFERTANIFLQWAEKEQIEATEVRYQDVLSFMKHCQKNGTTQRTVQHYLNSIKHFYSYLIGEKKIGTNPVAGIKVQGVKRKTLYHTFKPEELHAIYNSYQDGSLKGKRNKVMLGLIVYQGAKTEELIKLEVRDVKLREGKIEIPGG